MSHFKEVCSVCKTVIRQCRCKDPKVVYKICDSCNKHFGVKGVFPGIPAPPCEHQAAAPVALSCEEAAPSTDPKVYEKLCWDLFTIFDIPKDTPLQGVLQFFVGFKKRYDEAYPPGMVPADPTPSTDLSPARENLDFRKEVYDLFDIHRGTPLPKALKLLSDWRKRYNEKDAGYSHLMAVCEEALGKDGPFEATDAAERIKAVMQQNKTLKNTCEVYEHTVRKLKEDLDKEKDYSQTIEKARSRWEDNYRRFLHMCLDALKVEKNRPGTEQEVLDHITTLAAAQSVFNGFLAELRAALSEPTCDETHLINRVKGEVEVNRTVRGKLQAALGLKDEEVSSHYDLADDVCDRVGRYESLQMQLCEALHLAAGSDEALVRQVKCLHDFRKHVCTLLGTAPAPDSYILRVLAEKIHNRAALDALPRTWKAGEKVAPEDIKRGMTFVDSDGRFMQVIGFFADEKNTTVLVEDAGKRDDILERWEKRTLSCNPLAEDFTEVV